MLGTILKSGESWTTNDNHLHRLRRFQWPANERTNKQSGYPSWRRHCSILRRRWRDSQVMPGKLCRFDGKGNFKSTFIVNEPDPTSTTGAPKLVSGSQKGTYTINSTALV
jgi:hypothetical protein